MSKKKKGAPGRIEDMERFAKSMARTPYGSRQPMLIPLTVLATAVCLLGVPESVRQNTAKTMAEREDCVDLMQKLWAVLVMEIPYLKNVVHPLMFWMGDANDEDVKTARYCWEQLARYDLYLTLLDPQFGGDILGPFYTFMRSKSAIDATGAFYTPMPLSKMMAMMLDLKEHTSINDPCCGSGGMAVASISVMKENGLDPNTCTWVLNDIDPVAVALAGINMMIHGMDKVVLTADNALAPRQSEPAGLVHHDEERTA